MMKRSLACALLLAVSLSWPLVSPAAPLAGATDELATGTLIEGVACEADPTQTYSLYLPPGYPGERRWPALLIFDPRGRSRPAAEIFAAAAERFGWLILSSNDTRSDGPWEPNVKAVNAMLPELDRRWAVDPSRVYAAGFSGGAHVAWSLGVHTGRLAGVIASGGRVEADWMVDEVPFASYGAAGATDFNNAGMHAVDEHFGSHGAAHRLEIFAGPHRWMPAELAAEAVGWMEVVAMRQERRPLDRDLAGNLLGADLEKAAEREAAGDLLAAARRYEAILRTYQDWPREQPLDVEPAKDRLAALGAGKALRAAEREERRWAGYEASYRGKLGGVLARIRDVDEPMPVGRVLRELEIERLQRQVEKGGAGGVTAERLLETVFTQTAFYLMRDFLGSGQVRRAAVVLAVAAEIKPERPDVWYNLACARARDGDKKPAIEALRRAREAGWTDLDHLRQDPDLESLHGEEGWRELASP